MTGDDEPGDIPGDVAIVFNAILISRGQRPLSPAEFLEVREFVAGLLGRRE